MNGLFPTTRWTVIRNLARSGRHEHLPAWEEFVANYRRPLIVWLRMRCGNEDTSEELVQAFFVKLFAKKASFVRVDAANGRMRTWLLNALRNHWIDKIRKQRLPTVGLHEGLAAKTPDGEDFAYDLEWARSLAGRALDAMRADYESRGNGKLFLALLATIEDSNSSSHRERAAALEMKANGFAVALMRFRERVADRLWQEVAMTVQGGSGEVDEELRHLVAVLARTGGLASALGND